MFGLCHRQRYVLFALWLATICIAMHLAPQPGFAAGPEKETGLIENAAKPDTVESYRSSHNYLLSFPQLLWNFVVWPVGQAVIWEEHNAIHERVLSLLTFNKDRTAGIFPQFQFGGETGYGYGASLFHNNLFGSKKAANFKYIYSGDNDRQFAQFSYRDPAIKGGHFYWNNLVLWERTDYEDATINGELRRDDILFQYNSFRVNSLLGWRMVAAPFAPFSRNLYLSLSYEYSRNNLLVESAPPNISFSVRGLGEKITLHETTFEVTYDDRDYRTPAEQVDLPLNYRIPGRFLAFAGGRYHHLRNTYHPNNGGLIRLRGGVGSDFDSNNYFRYSVEAQRFFRLFVQNRVFALRARLNHVRGINRYRRVPYYELETLGDNVDLRGYERGYFRNHGSMLFSAEYRYPIWDYFFAFLFLDEGQSFFNYDDLDWKFGGDGFLYSYGAGITIGFGPQFLGKLQFARSKEEALLVGFVIEHEF